MKIKRIRRMRDCGIFREFTWPSDLREFPQFNLIYGWNGTGKTTLSRYFRDMELRRSPSNGHITFEIDGQEIESSDFPSTSIPVRVFNRDFVNENVFPTSGKDASPIFVLGSESVAKQKEIESLQSQLTEIEESLQEERRAKSRAVRDLDSHCIEYGRIIKESLRSTESNIYNNYNKRNYEQRAKHMIEMADAPSHLLHDQERDSLRVQRSSSPKIPISWASFDDAVLSNLRDTVSQILITSVASETIDSLQADPELSDWVYGGFNLHNQRNSAHCLYCTQPLASDRVSALNRHFSSAYQELIQNINDVEENLESISNTLQSMQIPIPAQFYEHHVAKLDEIENDIEAYRGKSAIFLADLCKLITKKRERPFESIKLDDEGLLIPESSSLAKLSEIVEMHNLECESHSDRVRKARGRLEADYVADSLVEYQRISTKILGHETSIEKNNSERELLIDQISHLEQEITDYRQPAEELALDLQTYLDHGVRWTQ